MERWNRMEGWLTEFFGRPSGVAGFPMFDSTGFRICSYVRHDDAITQTRAKSGLSSCRAVPQWRGLELAEAGLDDARALVAERELTGGLPEVRLG